MRIKESIADANEKTKEATLVLKELQPHLQRMIDDSNEIKLAIQQIRKNLAARRAAKR